MTYPIFGKRLVSPGGDTQKVDEHDDDDFSIYYDFVIYRNG